MRRARRWSIVLALPLVALALSRPASATYSIVATDTSTGQVGGATTSCVGSLSVSVVYGSAPGHGAVHAQAFFNTEGRDTAAARLAMDVDPAAIIVEITAPAFDGIASRRQYGLADLSGRAAGWTGVDCGFYAEDRQAQTGPYTYSLQGNILTSAAVLDQAQAAFEAGGCDLAERLMLALEAGAENGEGDSRCTPAGIPSDSAFLTVEETDGTPVLRLDVTDTSPASAVVELRAMYDAWRAANPCPALPPDAGPAAADAAVGGDAGMAGDDSGCSCRTSGGGGTSGAALLLALALLCCSVRSLTLPSTSTRPLCEAWPSGPAPRRRLAEPASPCARSG